MRIHNIALMASVVCAACVAGSDGAKTETTTDQAALAYTEEGPDVPTNSPATDSLPDGFADWCAVQCPDNRVVVLADPGTGKVVHSMSCEDVRGKALADPSARASL